MKTVLGGLCLLGVLVIYASSRKARPKLNHEKPSVKFIKAQRPRRTYIKTCCGKLRCWKNGNVSEATTNQKTSVTTPAILKTSTNLKTKATLTSKKAEKDDEDPEDADDESESKTPSSEVAATQTQKPTESSETSTTIPTSTTAIPTTSDTSTSVQTTTAETTTTTTTTTTSTTTTTTTTSTTTTTTTTSTTTTTTTQPTTTSTTTTELTTTTEFDTDPSYQHCPPIECNPDPNILSPSGQIKVDENPVPGDGTYRIACGRIYFTSFLKKTWADAASDCCRRNMSLLAIESDAEHDCLKNTFFLNDRYWKENNSYFHTSGSDFGKEGVYKWCFDQKTKPLINTTLIRFHPGNPDNYDNNEHCLTAIIVENDQSIISLNDLPCDADLVYICEAPLLDGVPFPKCPDDICVKSDGNATTVSTTIDQMIAENLTSFEFEEETIFAACDLFYLRSHKLMNFTDAFSLCCHFGMQLIVIDSEKELNCLYNVSSTDLLPRDNFYWTAATNQGALSEENFGWCGNQKILMSQSGELWNKSFQKYDIWLERCSIFFKPSDPLTTIYGLLSEKCSNEEYALCKK